MAGTKTSFPLVWKWISERASKQMSTKSKAEQENEWAVQVNEWASSRVFTSGFLLFLTMAKVKKNLETVAFESGVARGMTLEPSCDTLLLHQHHLLGGTWDISEFYCNFIEIDSSAGSPIKTPAARLMRSTLDHSVWMSLFETRMWWGLRSNWRRGLRHGLRPGLRRGLRRLMRCSFRRGLRREGGQGWNRCFVRLRTLNILAHERLFTKTESYIGRSKRKSQKKKSKSQMRTNTLFFISNPFFLAQSRRV